MAEGNGEISSMRTDDYQKLLGYGLDEKVAAKLDDIYKTGKLAHVDLDERAVDALKEFTVDAALSVLTQFLDSNLEHVSNKSAYLCGVMKTYRQKNRGSASSNNTTNATTASQNNSTSGATGTTTNSSTGGQTQNNATTAKGPDEEKIKQILDRTGYTLDVTTGQRKYGGPPPGWEGSPPGSGCEVFCGKIPKDIFEDELIPLFEACGTIWDLRLMMDPMTGTNRGYAFVTFTNREAAQSSVQKLDNHEIRPGKNLKINVSVPILRLFVGNIPKSKGKEEIMDEFGKLTAGLCEAIIYSSPDDKKKNRGFCFLEYESHKAASMAKRRLGTGRIKVWGCDIIVDWADPQEEPDEQTMSKVKVLYVRNLTQDIGEEKLKEVFEAYGKVERVKKIKDYAFVHFEDRDNAVKAMRELDGTDMGGSIIEVSLAKPPSDKKKKEEILRARERRMMQMLQGRGIMMPTNMPMRGQPGQVRNSGVRGAPMGRGDYDYDYEYYGYGDYRGGYSDPYYDDYSHGYEDYTYYDYQPAVPQVRGRSRQPQPDLDEGSTLSSSNMYYDVGSGTQVGRGRGAAARGRVGGPIIRGSPVSRAALRGGPIGVRGGVVRGPGAARGQGRGKPNLPAGKRKFDGGYPIQGETKRRFQSNWGMQPLPQQSMMGLDMNGDGDDGEWYNDSYGSW